MKQPDWSTMNRHERRAYAAKMRRELRQEKRKLAEIRAIRLAMERDANG